jgi:peptidoglycan lytic transglycosylase
MVSRGRRPALERLVASAWQVSIDAQSPCQEGVARLDVQESLSHRTGLVAYYSKRLNGGRTASGERFNNGAMTTAHQTLPYGTKVRVTNTKNGKSVVLRVNDRGPTQPNRILDVSRAAAQRLGFIRAGLIEVKLEVVEAAKSRRRA